MNRVKDYIESGKLSVLYRVILLLWDIAAVFLSSVLALYLRYNMNWSSTLASGIEKSYPRGYMGTIEDLAVPTVLITIAIFAFLRMYNSLWRYASTREVINIIVSCVFAGLAHYLVVSGTYHRMPRTYFVFFIILLFLLTFAVRFSYRLVRFLFTAGTHGKGVRNTMIIGAGEACNIVITELQMSQRLDSRICCIIDDNKAKHGLYIKGIKVIGGRSHIESCVKKYDIDEIILAMPSASKKEVKEILDVCQNTDCELKILPGVYQFVTGEARVEKIRKVEIEDLLGREPVRINLDSFINYVSNKVVLITGGGGSIGSELCRQIAANRPKTLIILDIYENNAYDIQQELIRKYPNLHLEVLIGSVRNTNRIDSIFKEYRPDVVYHAAAHKHVPLMESSPNEAIKNNVFGTYHVALAADKYRTKKFVLISTDKAVNPTNIMGASKRICEMIVQGLNRNSDTEFVAVRFGNVLGSNGSVIPLFKKQIAEGGPVTVTHPEIIRYFMTIPEAVSLVIQAGVYAKGGEIFVLDMGAPVSIAELAEKLIQLSGYSVGTDIEIKYTGLRPGEKLYEEILMDEEGLTDTENEMIHIGKPIEFDEEEFFEILGELYQCAYEETHNMKELIAKIVPTYKINVENEKKHKKTLEIKTNNFYSKRMDSEKYLEGNI